MSRPLHNNTRVALIHVARKQLSLADEDYRAILRGFGGAEHANELSDYGFERVMERFSQLGFRSKRNQGGFGRRHEDWASPAQVNLMRKLWQLYCPEDRGEAKLNAWLAKYHHVAALRMVTRQKAVAVLFALKKMTARRQGGDSRPAESF